VKLDVNDLCFACGQNNPIGLKLRFRFENEDYVADFEVKPEYQGWAGIVHGGLLATALDEVMARLLWEKGINAITGRLTVRYHQPLSIGDHVQVRGRITRHRLRVVETTAEAVRPDGGLAAEAIAVSMEV